MSTLNLDENNAIYQIRAYQPGNIQINDQVLTRSLIVTAERLIEDWQPQTIDDLKSDSLDILLDLQVEIVLIGTGSKHELIDIDLYGKLINNGIGVEIMDTRAACRTYNALSAENRNVAAALIIR